MDRLHRHIKKINVFSSIPAARNKYAGLGCSTASAVLPVYIRPTLICDVFIAIINRIMLNSV